MRFSVLTKVIIMTIGFHFFVKAQTADDYKQEVDYLFGTLNQSKIHTGILLDYGLDFAEVPLFDGQYRNENRSNMLTFRSVYGTLISSVINPNASIPPIAQACCLCQNIGSVPLRQRLAEEA